MTDQIFHPPRQMPVLEVHGHIQALPTSKTKGLQAEPFQGTKNIMASWLKSRFGDVISERLQEGQDFSYTDGEDSHLEVICNGKIWAFRALYPARDGRLWITEASLEQHEKKKKNGPPRINLDVAHKAVLAAGETGATIHYPEFVRSIASEYNLLDRHTRLTGRAVYIDDEKTAAQWAERLNKHMESQEFEQPVILFVPPPPSDERGITQKMKRGREHEERTWKNEVLARIPDLAQDTAGVAHIVALAPHREGVFARTLGGRFTTDSGQIRIYGPARQPDEPFSMTSAIHGRERGWPGFFDFLKFRLAQTSCPPASAPKKPSPFFQAQTKLTQLRASADAPVLKPENDPQFILEVLSQITNRVSFIQSLRANDAKIDPEETTRELKGYREHIATFRTKDEALKALIHEAATQVHDLDAEFAAVRYGITKSHTQKYEDLVSWVEKNYADKIVLADKVKSALKNPSGRYHDVNLVYAAVEMLAQQYYKMKMAEKRGSKLIWEEQKKTFTERLATLRLDDGRSMTNMRDAKLSRHYKVTVDKKEHLLDRHLAHGNSPDSREALRIYYAWDGKRVVVGGMFTHKPNKLTT